MPLPLFIHLPLFEQSIKGWLNDDTLRAIQEAIGTDPRRAPVIPGTDGVRKMR